MCALGAGVSETGNLNPKGRDRALAAMIRFKHLADGMGLSELTVVATAAVRDAQDGPAFCADVLLHTGLRIWGHRRQRRGAAFSTRRTAWLAWCLWSDLRYWRFFDGIG